MPGNRLRLMPGVYDPAQAAKIAAQMHATTGRYRRSWSPNAKVRNSTGLGSNAKENKPSRLEIRFECGLSLS